MLIKRPSDIRPSKITAARVSAAARIPGRRGGLRRRSAIAGRAARAAPPAAKSPFSTDEPLTPLKDITSYNNFYEFGTGKGDPGGECRHAEDEAVDRQSRRPGRQAGRVRPRRPHQAIALEERIYRMRCVEGWSMVIPWVGFPLARVL